MDKIKPIVLIDCDGVLANFAEKFAATLFEVAPDLAVGCPGAPPVPVEGWAPYRNLTPPTRARVWKEVKKPGWADTLKPYPGAQGFMARLEEIAEVFVVTTPMRDSTTWVFDRESWLRRMFEIGSSRIIHARTKERVHGDVFIDDKLSNVELWHRTWKGRPCTTIGETAAVLWEPPGGVAGESSEGIFRMRTWQEVLALVRERAMP